MIKSILTEYGIPWVFNRTLYSLKLKVMRIFPLTEKAFECNIKIKRINIVDIDASRIDKFLNELPQNYKNEIIRVADNAIKGKIKAFSSIDLDYGNPINWHINPITNIEVDKRLKWYKISDFDPTRGDIKAVWEASRFTHFFYFSRAYMITKDIKYYEAFSNQIDYWLKENSYSYGANYKCGQEATLRMINALISYSVFKFYGLTSDYDELNLKKIVEGSYKKIISNFFYAHKCIKNNHSLSEITGLIIGAWCAEDQLRLNKAYDLIDKEINRQFLSDGGYIQNSVNYQRFALQLIEFILKISTTTKIQISDRNKQLIIKSAHQLYQIQDDIGDVPNRGANDGALIFPVTSCSYRDFRPIINSISSLINNKRLYDAGIYDEEILWFSENSLKDIRISKVPKESCLFFETGLFTLRHKNGFLMTIFQNVKTRPGQMDQFHIDLWHKGINILCDAGSYSYASDIGKKLALTGSHNTVKVDDKEQMKKRGPFFVYDWVSTKDIEVSLDSISGTMVSKNGYSHRRQILRNRNNYYIEDEVMADGNQCTAIFLTPCDVEITDGGVKLIINDEVLAYLETDEKIKIVKDYRSLYYLRKDEINKILINKNMSNEKCLIKTKITLTE